MFCMTYMSRIVATTVAENISKIAPICRVIGQLALVTKMHTEILKASTGDLLLKVRDITTKSTLLNYTYSSTF